MNDKTRKNTMGHTPMNTEQLLRITALVYGIALSGCSYATVTTKAEDPADCTQHYTAPVADTLMVVPPLLLLALLNSGPTCCGGGSGGSTPSKRERLENTVLLGSVSLLFGFSASHGYSEVKTCRAPRYHQSR